MSQFPPNWITRILRFFFKPELWESIEGDLEELYCYELERMSSARARWRYFVNAVAFFRYHRLRQYSKTHNQMDLLKNYLKVSIRDIRRHRLFSSINLLGLVTGFTVMLLVLQYALFQFGFDQFNEKFDRTYRIVNDRYQNGERVQRGAITYPTIGPTLKKDYPEVVAYTRLTVGSRNYLHYDHRQFLMENFMWADEHFFEVFDYPILEGDPITALKESAQVVISESYAQRLLNEGQTLNDLMGQQVLINDWDFHCQIKAVMKDMPVQSHLHSDVLISYNTFIRLAGEGADNSWMWSDFYHYIVLEEGTDPAAFDAKLQEFGNTYFKNGEISGAEEKFELQPLAKLHFDDSLEYEYADVMDGQFVWMILAIALIIMFIAWINYINLTTSRALERAKEVGVRKAMGAFSQQVFGQFLTESFLLNTLALILALLIVVVVQPIMIEIVDLPLDLSVFVRSTIYEIPFIPLFLGVFLVVVCVIGIYPARLISRFRPEEVIKGKYSLVGDMVNMRRFLVVTQFATALILVSASISVYRQIDFMRSQDLGMELKNNLVLYGPDLTDFDSVYIAKFESFKNELVSHPQVLSVSSTGRLFGDKMSRGFTFQSSADPDKHTFGSNWMPMDHQFVEQFGIDVLSGRSFDRSDYHTDGGQVNTAMLNQSALKLFKFDTPEDAIGGQVIVKNSGREYRIVGVVSDFHQRTLKETIEPIIFFPFHDNSHFITVKYVEGKEKEAIALAQDEFMKFYPGNYFDYLFLEEHFDANYQSDQTIGVMSAGLTVIAIILAVLGLYGLVLVTLQKGTKEIGIRKVLGANVGQLLSRFGGQFVVLIVVASIIGIPASSIVIQGFLQDYSYSIGLEWWVIVVSALIMLGLCVVTVLLQTSRIAKNNPIESLRYE